MLLQAGGWDWNPLIHIPVGAYSVFKDKSMIWNLESEPEPDCHGRRIELPRGKVVGGSLSVNAMVCLHARVHARLRRLGRAARIALKHRNHEYEPELFLGVRETFRETRYCH